MAVSPPEPGVVSMKGKTVLLQRQVGGKWRLIRRGKLVFKPRFDFPYNHEVAFVVPKRGWKLRAILPARSAAPCYTTGAIGPWRS